MPGDTSGHFDETSDRRLAGGVSLGMVSLSCLHGELLTYQRDSMARESRDQVRRKSRTGLPEDRVGGVDNPVEEMLGVALVLRVGVVGGHGERPVWWMRGARVSEERMWEKI